MKNYWTRFHQFTIATLLTIIILINVESLQAQPPSPPGDPESAPVDGGLTILIAAGIGYASKRIKQIQEGNGPDEKRP